jgi:hypothetical protein
MEKTMNNQKIKGVLWAIPPTVIIFGGIAYVFGFSLAVFLVLLGCGLSHCVLKAIEHFIE